MSDNEKSNKDLEMPVKKKRRRLSIEERIMIIDKLASGYSNSRLAQEFGVSGAAITKIGKNIENYINYNETSDSNAPRKKVADNTAFERAIFKWYKQKRCLGEAVPVHVLRDKAVELNEKMNGYDTFRAGNSWVQRFKERHNIRHFPNHKSDVEDDVAVTYCKDLIKLIEEHNIDPDNIYNADETMLAWRSIPRERSLYKRKMPLTGVDTVTVMVCCNATGTHKLPLLIIGTDELQDNADSESLPLIYKNQRDGLMNKEIFLKWYTELFLPEIRERHENDNERCILIIDSAPVHLSAEVLNKEDEICNVRPIHFEITSRIQPLNHGIIRSLKAIYKTKLVSKLLAQKSLDIDVFCNNFTLFECCKYLADSWNQVSKTDIKKAWQQVIVREEKRIKFEDDTYISSLMPLLRKLPSCSRYNLHNTRNWVEEELEQPGWEVLTDDEILSEVMRDHREAIKQYETQITSSKDKKRSRKPLANNYETSQLEPEIPEENTYNPTVIIKEEVDELILDDSDIKRELCEDPIDDRDDEVEVAVQPTTIYLDEYSGNQLELEDESELDRLKDDEPVVILNNDNDIMINDVRSGAYIGSYHGRSGFRDESSKKGSVPSAFDAMTSIDIVYKWFERRIECKQEDLIRLRQMREIARKEILVTVSKP